jgi:hypothetical protein
MGFRGPRANPRRKALVRLPSQLTPDQEMHLWLGCGPRSNLRPFASEEARRAAWIDHRDYLMGMFSSPGRRPQAWWAYEASIAFPGIERQASTLYAAGILGEAEKAALEAGWRREFDEAQDPDFWICLGPGEMLEGAAARRAHYRDVDIPPELVKRWTAERRRQARTIRQLQDAAECESVLPPV